LEHSVPALVTARFSADGVPAAADITAINEPKRISCGAPDFAVFRKSKHGPLIVGYVEAKDTGSDLDQIETNSQRLKPQTRDGAQLKRFRTLPNLIMTNYLEFRW
jgi:hypothetical protein